MVYNLRARARRLVDDLGKENFVSIFGRGGYMYCLANLRAKFGNVNPTTTQFYKAVLCNSESTLLAEF